MPHPTPSEEKLLELLTQLTAVISNNTRIIAATGELIERLLEHIPATHEAKLLGVHPKTVLRHRRNC